MTHQNEFIKHFKHQPTHIFFSPGRVNLIGEHTDYSGGLVFPMALSLGITGYVSRRDDQLIKVFSTTFESKGILTIALDDLSYKKGFSFGNYVQGVLAILRKAGYSLPAGFNLFMHSTLPASAGLSSSAALEMLLFEVIDTLYDLNLDAVDKVKYAKQVENHYMGVSSGIMDQYAVKFGKKDHAIYLNTHTLTFEYAPIDLKRYTLLLMNTNKSRNLEDSDYNERFKSVEIGTNILKKHLDIDVLGDVDEQTFNKVQSTLNDDLLVKRLRHVVSENTRTKQAYNALKNHDLKTFGKMMDGSHQSLKNDFEVSCEELDYLVRANKQLGAIGARMTGAGFGGTMIAIYESKALPPSFKTLKENYQKRFNKPLDIYQAKSADGAKLIKEVTS